MEGYSEAGEAKFLAKKHLWPKLDNRSSLRGTRNSLGESSEANVSLTWLDTLSLLYSRRLFSWASLFFGGVYPLCL